MIIIDIDTTCRYGGSLNKVVTFIDELNELQEELECPDEFIYDFMEAIRNRWSPDSCHSQARNLKRKNPDAY